MISERVFSSYVRHQIWIRNEREILNIDVLWLRGCCQLTRNSPICDDLKCKTAFFCDEVSLLRPIDIAADNRIQLPFLLVDEIFSIFGASICWFVMQGLNKLWEKQQKNFRYRFSSLFDIQGTKAQLFRLNFPQSYRLFASDWVSFRCRDLLQISWVTFWQLQSKQWQCTDENFPWR